jgi:hypothetical protein
MRINKQSPFKVIHRLTFLLSGFQIWCYYFSYKLTVKKFTFLEFLFSCATVFNFNTELGIMTKKLGSISKYIHHIGNDLRIHVT